MKKKICKYLSGLLEEMSEEELFQAIEIPPDETMGDFALPCYVIAKKLHKNPMVIATAIVEKLKEQKDALEIEKAEMLELIVIFI